MQWLFNRRAIDAHEPYPERFQSIISLSRHAEAQAEIRSWPGYEPTPLLRLDNLARELGVGEIIYKDEGPRFGLGSFKALGGAYAAGQALLRRLRQKGVAGAEAHLSDLHSGNLAPFVMRQTLVTATDGNHGRAVAWGARNFGARAIIYLHQHVNATREAAIRALGAEVVRVPGNYDDSVRRAAFDAKANNYLVVSDTSHDGHDDVAADVMQGYTVMLGEILEASSPPTHVFVQAGVGALAAAVCAYFWEGLGPDRPRIIVVESEVADCLYRSAVSGRPVAVEGDHHTIMAGLACGEVSEVAWEILNVGANAFLTIDDDLARQAMRRLFRPSGNDPQIVAGESGAAGLGGLLAAISSTEAREQLSLDSSARVLLIGTERDTDPESFAAIVGSDVGVAA